MIRIAVLGDVGSGKSYVAKQFGYPVFNADTEVVKLYRKSRNCYKKLKKALPKYIISFPIKKIEISTAIMDSHHNLKKIVKIVHPEVRVKKKKKKINERLKKKPNFNSKIIKKFKKLQLPIEFKRRQSNFIIKNNFRNNSIKKNVKKILEKIL